MQCLRSTLEGEVALLKRLVECTQREKQQILAFEPEGLDSIVQEKQKLLEQLNVLHKCREVQLQEELRASNAPDGYPTSLTALISLLPDHLARELEPTRDTLRSLLEALQELNMTAGFHAERQLVWVRNCKKALRKTNPSTDQSYGPSGRMDDALGGGVRLNASV
jgi:flagellar biosynthesis/type III secretory pathway chaperone